MLDIFRLCPQNVIFPPIAEHVSLHGTYLCKNMARASGGGGANIMHPLSWGGGGRNGKDSLCYLNIFWIFSVCGPRLVYPYYLKSPDAGSIFLHNDLLHNLSGFRAIVMFFLVSACIYWFWRVFCNSLYVSYNIKIVSHGTAQKVNRQNLHFFRNFHFLS